MGGTDLLWAAPGEADYSHIEGFKGQRVIFRQRR